MFGVLKEHGPFLADIDLEGRPTLAHNPYSWAGNYSVLYVDNPVGTGFSFTDDPAALPRFVEESTEDLYHMLQQFFKIFPEVAASQFYAMGESYGGKYVPSLAYKIHMENEAAKVLSAKAKGGTTINLAGLAVGNGWMSPLDQGKYASYLFFHGLLDSAQYGELDAIGKAADAAGADADADADADIMPTDGGILDIISRGQWLEAWQASDHQLNYILTALNYSNLYDISMVAPASSIRISKV
jgi:vitellogenic carboxypeptidase-like protein